MRVRRGTPRSAPATGPSPAGRSPGRTGPAGRHRGPQAREETADGPGPAAAPARSAGLRLRPRTVRARIVALLMVPVVSVLALWSFATVTTARGVWDTLHLKAVTRTVLDPVAATVAGLQAERTAAGQLLAGGPPGRENALREAAAATDRAAAPLHLADGYNRADAEGLGDETAGRVDELTAAVAALPALRAKVLQHQAGWPETYAAYSAAIDRALEVTGSVTALQDHRVASDARVLLEFSRARELLAREDSLLRAGQTAGGLGEAQRGEFGAAVYARRLFAQTASRDLRPADRSALQAVTGGADYRELVRLEDAVRDAPDGRAALQTVPADRWADLADATARGLAGVERAAGSAAAERSDPYALGLFTPAGLAVLLGLAAVLASLLISVQIGRGLVTELVRLRNSALELAGRTLPATMRRLRAGEEIDIAAEAPLRPHGGDEIGQVRGALGRVQRAAVTAAVERAEVLSGVSGVFVNLARRSQVLVHRQLTLLDAMERRTEDPAELADLFRLDHLTTRMRRHAEGLIILSGAAPGRAWRKPVPLMDVVRAAVAEVEEYARVEVHRLPYAAVSGQAVADLTHLVAELVENATGFSPPHTRVHVRGEQVGNGYAVEIEDRGLGMGPEALADANRRIEASEQVDLFDSDRLGLFVVSRLARRHGVRVSLRPSAYGGTTAVVLLPNALLETGTAAEAKPAEDVLPVAPAPERPERPEQLDPPIVRPLPTAAPFGALGGDPGVLRPTPFRADGTRPAPGVPSVPPARSAEPPAPAPAAPAPAAPAPAVPAGRPAAAPARRPAAAPARAVQAAPAGDREDRGDGELPRRVRQASLVPQLREAPARPPTAPRRDGGQPVGRNPEEARAAMSAFQRGWARGATEPPIRPNPTGGEHR
ncbi:nitrate- and nitrite sensing domain-containing protein [Streptomyces sp. NRRL B-24484]|uniref:sensor histidine kinase n=1 Tax=Streptomyces sp. NRRL B-24484 TaxID=1463833 RepID=UPI0006940AC1|nr:nitrate- and nitrite sensing domain-containing protein [Streptomyces sp. NRRL B-24484]